jgi:hypothetical protein
MNTLRKCIAWYFAFQSAFFFAVAANIAFSPRPTGQDHPAPLAIRAAYYILIASIGPIFGMAWWTVWRRKPSGRFWAISTGALLPLTLTPVLYRGWAVLWQSELAFSDLTVIGLLAVIPFLQPYKLAEEPKVKCRDTKSIPGDGTSTWFFVFATLCLLATLIGGVPEFTRWLQARGFLGMHEGHQGVLWLVLGLIAVHELGHAAAGVAFGMKVVSLAIGPFQWKKRDGKWRFEFRLKEFFNGSTGLVSPSPDFPLWQKAFVVASGAFANFIIGLLCAIRIAISGRSGPPMQSWAPLVYFGAYNLTIGAFNLLPVRMSGAYSDGAQIYQALSKGPWSDYHRVGTMVESSLVTPIRPRDYDVAAIQRAAAAIVRGRQGLCLQLFLFYAFLDRGNCRGSGGH